MSANKKSRLKYSLAKNETVLFRYYSFSKKWSYVSYKGQLLVTLTDDISLDHVRYKDWAVAKLYLEIILYVCSILFLILIYRQAGNRIKVQNFRNAIARLNEQKIKAITNEVVKNKKVEISTLAIKSTTGKILEYGELTRIY